LGQQGFGELGDQVWDQRVSRWGLENSDHRGRGGLDGDVMDDRSEGLQGHKEEGVILSPKFGEFNIKVY
jgi:hypothetical protein